MGRTNWRIGWNFSTTFNPGLIRTGCTCGVALRLSVVPPIRRVLRRGGLPAPAALVPLPRLCPGGARVRPVLRVVSVPGRPARAPACPFAPGWGWPALVGRAPASCRRPAGRTLTRRPSAPPHAPLVSPPRPCGSGGLGSARAFLAPAGFSRPRLSLLIRQQVPPMDPLNGDCRPGAGATPQIAWLLRLLNGRTDGVGLLLIHQGWIPKIWKTLINPPQ